MGSVTNFMSYKVGGSPKKTHNGLHKIKKKLLFRKEQEYAELNILKSFNTWILRFWVIYYIIKMKKFLSQTKKFFRNVSYNTYVDLKKFNRTTII